jgi:hypothetical protein
MDRYLARYITSFRRGLLAGTIIWTLFVIRGSHSYSLTNVH